MLYWKLFSNSPDTVCPPPPPTSTPSQEKKNVLDIQYNPLKLKSVLKRSQNHKTRLWNEHKLKLEWQIKTIVLKPSMLKVVFNSYYRKTEVKYVYKQESWSSWSLVQMKQTICVKWYQLWEGDWYYLSLQANCQLGCCQIPAAVGWEF